MEAARLRIQEVVYNYNLQTAKDSQKIKIKKRIMIPGPCRFTDAVLPTFFDKCPNSHIKNPKFSSHKIQKYGAPFVDKKDLKCDI